MELRTVNTFLHIAELHSFSRTARQLGYSQSAVSSQIAQLEAELGTPLFDRVGKTVRLTDAGQTFLRYARTLLETAQQAQAALQPAQQVRGSLRIALADSVCSTFLPGLLQRYHARCPQVELVLHTASTDEMLQLLSTNQVDLVYTLDQPLLQPALVLAAEGAGPGGEGVVGEPLLSRLSVIAGSRSGLHGGAAAGTLHPARLKGLPAVGTVGGLLCVHYVGRDGRWLSCG